jgi:hypothetical protein
MKIAIMSDSHNRWQNLTSAVEWANEEKCDKLLFAGDLVRKEGIAILAQFNKEVVLVWGNNQMRNKIVKEEVQKYSNVKVAGVIYKDKIANQNIIMSHLPSKVESQKNKDCDIAIHGHTHEYREEVVDEVKFICPGEISGHKTREVSFAVVDLQSIEVERFIL